MDAYYLLQWNEERKEKESCSDNAMHQKLIICSHAVEEKKEVKTEKKNERDR